MAINKKLIHFKTKSVFNQKLANNEILDTSIVFIQDTREIWTHGQFYDCSGGTTTDTSQWITEEELQELLSPIQSSLVNKLEEEDLEGYAKTEDVPTKLSDLTDDSDFITNTEATAAYAPKSLVETVDNQAITISTLATKSELSTGLAGKLDNSAASGFVPTTRKINGVALDKDITITATDPNAATKTELNSVNTDLQTFKSNVATTYATDLDVANAVSALVDSSPDTLNTLNELAAALGDDPNFATTVATNIGKKADKTELSDLQTSLNNLHTVARTGNYWSLKNIPNVNMRGVEDGDPKNKTHYVYLEDEIAGELGSIYFSEEEYHVDDFSETLPREEQIDYYCGEMHYSYGWFEFNPKETKIIVEILNNADDENVSSAYGSYKILAFDLEDQDIDLRPYLVPNSYITDNGPVTFKLICLNQLRADDFDGYSKELDCYLIVNNYVLNWDYLNEFNDGTMPRVRIRFGKIKELDDCFIPDNIVRKSDLIENQGEFDEKVFEGDLGLVSEFRFNPNDYIDALLDVDLHYYINSVDIKHLKQSFVAPKLLEDEWALLYEDTDEILEEYFGGPFSIMYNSPSSYPDESCFTIDHLGGRVWGKATVRLVKSYKTFDEKYLPDLSDKYIPSSLLEENTLLHSGNVGEYNAGGIKVKQVADTDDLSNYIGSGTGISFYTNDHGEVIGDIGSTSATLVFGHAANRMGRFIYWRNDKSNNLYWQSANGSANAWGTKRQIAFTDSNVASATKLATARTIWGQSFDGTGNINGDFTIGKTRGIYLTDTSNVARKALYLHSTNNNLHLGSDTSMQGYNTYINGANVFLRYGTSRSLGFVLNSSGNVTIGSDDLAGTNAKLYVDAATGDGKPALLIDSSTSLQWNYLASFLAKNTDVDAGTSISIGKDHSTYNSGLITFRYKGVNSSNYLSLHLYGKDDILNVMGSGNVGIGTTSPAYKLDVAGSFNATSGSIGGKSIATQEWVGTQIPSKFTGSSVTTSGNSGTAFSAAPAKHTHSVTASGSVSSSFTGSAVTSGGPSSNTTSVATAAHTHSVTGTVANGGASHKHSYTPAGSVSSSFSGTAATSGQNSGTNFSAAPGGHTHSVTASGSVSSSFTGSAVTSGANSGTNFSAAPGGHTHSVTASGTVTLSGSAADGVLTITASFSGSAVTSGANSGTNTSVSPASHTHSVTAAGSVSSSFTGSAVTSGANSGTNTSVAPAKHTHSVTATGSVSSSFTGTASDTGSTTATHSHTFSSGSASATADNTTNRVSVPNTSHTHSVTAAGSVSSSFTGSAATSGENSGTNGSVAPAGHTHTVTATGSIS